MGPTLWLTNLQGCLNSFGKAWYCLHRVCHCSLLTSAQVSQSPDRICVNVYIIAEAPSINISIVPHTSVSSRSSQLLLTKRSRVLIRSGWSRAYPIPSNVSMPVSPSAWLCQALVGVISHHPWPHAKGAPAWESQTGAWLVSPAVGCEKKNWDPQF